MLLLGRWPQVCVLSSTGCISIMPAAWAVSSMGVVHEQPFIVQLGDTSIERSPPENIDVCGVPQQVLQGLSGAWCTFKDDEPCYADEAWVDALHGWSTLIPHCGMIGMCASSMKMHGPHVTDPKLSEYSDVNWAKLVRKEWYSCDISCYFKSAHDEYELHLVTETAPQTRYHGTTLKAALSMLRTGGFIPGPNGHGYRGKYLQGFFCTTSVGDAFCRVDPTRELQNDRLHLMGCPVVVEVKVAHLQQYHRHRHDVSVAPGRPGVLMSGVQLTRIHVNSRYFWNFAKALFRDVKPSEACGTGCPAHTTCGAFISHEAQCMLGRQKLDAAVGYKSGKGYVYCPKCAPMTCMKSKVIGVIE